MTREDNTDPNNVPRATDPPDNSQQRSEISEDAQLPPTRIPHGCSGEKKKHWLDHAIFWAAVIAGLAAVAAEQDRQLVADEFAAAVGEDRWPLDQARPVLLAAPGKESSDAAFVWKHGAADCCATGASGVGEPVDRRRFE